jgi:hypothetical protein
VQLSLLLLLLLLLLSASEHKSQYPTDMHTRLLLLPQLLLLLRARVPQLLPTHL